MYIAIAGNLGSGKTTLARELAAILGWPVVPKSSYDNGYLVDLFSDPSRWSFEAQSAFLLHKFRNIVEAIKSGRPFILDRSMSEDVFVFCKYFHINGYMNDRAFTLLCSLYEMLTMQILPPSIVLFCRSSAGVCQERALKRPREYQKLYPHGHFQKLDELYSDWVRIKSTSLTFEINTEINDIRARDVVTSIIDEVNVALERYVKPFQPTLFDMGCAQREPSSNIARVVTEPVEANGPLKPLTSRPLRIYLAAPFTSAASTNVVPRFDDWDNGSNPTSTAIIPRGKYRRTLLSIVSALRGHGYDVILPHRDINKWGLNNLSHKDVAERCIDAVRSADAFVGLIGNSYGAHVELGVAIGAGLPSLIVLTDDADISFFGKAVSQCKYVQHIKMGSLRNVAKSFAQHDLVKQLLFP